MRRSGPSILAISRRSSADGGDLVGWAESVARAGVDAVQIREKDLAACRLFAVVAAVVAALPSRVTVLVNGRADVALAARAAGVHLPSRSVPIALLREQFPDLLIGASTHTVEEIAAARDAGADYVTYGPVFPPTSKSAALPPVGVERLAAAVRLGVPVLALGGANLARLPAIAAAGAAGVAAIGAFQRPADAHAFVAAARRLFGGQITESAPR